MVGFRGRLPFLVMKVAILKIEQKTVLTEAVIGSRKIKLRFFLRPEIRAVTAGWDGQIAALRFDANGCVEFMEWCDCTESTQFQFVRVEGKKILVLCTIASVQVQVAMPCSGRMGVIPNLYQPIESLTTSDSGVVLLGKTFPKRDLARPRTYEG